MELTMKVKGQVVDIIKVYVPMCGDERYLAWLKKELRQKHRHIFLNETSEPLFFLNRVEQE
jgi:hypothetical protein